MVRDDGYRTVAFRLFAGFVPPVLPGDLIARRFASRVGVGEGPWPRGVRRPRLSAQPKISTGFPRTSARGLTPRPGPAGAAMRPRTRRGAPSAMLTVT